MLKICLVFWKSEPQYAYKRYAYEKKHVYTFNIEQIFNIEHALIHFCQLEVSSRRG